MIRYLVSLIFCGLLIGCEGENDAGKRYLDASERMVAARTYLARVEEQGDVRRSPSGLLYRINKPGDPTRARPRYSDDVLVNYRGSFADGEGFDSSYDGNVPVRFAVGDVIAGWREGLMMMREGSSYTFYIPPQLGYGARGSPPIIPPNAALVYDIELLAIYAPDGS